MTKERQTDQAAPALGPQMWPAASGWTAVFWAGLEDLHWYHGTAPVLFWRPDGANMAPVAPTVPSEALAARRFVLLPPNRSLDDNVVTGDGLWFPNTYVMLSALRLNWERDTGRSADQPAPAPRPPKPSGMKPLNPKKPRRLA